MAFNSSFPAPPSMDVDHIGSPPPPAPLFRYTDATANTDREIFIASPAEYASALSLHEAGDWAALAKFPPYSDMPPLEPLYCNVMSFTGEDGSMKSIHLPDDEGRSVQKATEFFVREEWGRLEREFEPWANQPRKKEIEDASAEWQRGVERCARAREAANPSRENSQP